MSESFLINNPTEENEGDVTMDKDPSECADDLLLDILDLPKINGYQPRKIGPSISNTVGKCTNHNWNRMSDCLISNNLNYWRNCCRVFSCI